MLYPPKSNWSEKEFKKRSYERTTVRLILESIKNSPDESPKDIIYSFIMKMDDLYESEYCKECAEDYILAREIAKEIYYLFC